MIHIYRLIAFFIYPLFFLFSLFSKKTRMYLFRRESNIPKSTNIKPIWIHASSGEFEHAKFLIKSIKEKYPLQKVVVSYSSPSYFHAVKNFEYIDGYFPMPVDLKAPIHSIIKQVNPKIVLFSRTDVWPEFSHQLKSKKIPSLVFSRMEKDKKSFVSSFLSILTYGKIDFISFVSNKDRDLFIEKNGEKNNLSVDGDPRIEEVLERASLIKKENHEERIFVLGSVWKEDLDKISKPLINSLKSGKITQIIAAPHDPSQKHFDEIRTAFKGLSTSLLSEKNEDSDVIIVDKLGVLFELYSKAYVAFVGGSFKKRVHSVIEPLSYGTPVLVGPYIDNNREAKTYSNKNARFVFKSDDEKEFDTNLKKLLSLNKNEYENLSDQILCELQSSSGASEKIINRISDLIDLDSSL